MIVGVVPALNWLFFILFLLVLPWLILKATQFNMRNSSYRQIRFDFLGQMGDLFVCYVLLPVVSAFTLWLAYPFAVFKQKQYMADNTRFGQCSFSFQGTSKEFFSTYFNALLGVILLFIFLGFIFGDSAQHFVQGFKEGIAQQQVQQLAPAAAQLPVDQPKPDPKIVAKVMLGAMAVYGVLLFLGLIVMTYINTRLTNYVFNNLKLKFVRFKVNIGFLRLLWIYLSNTLLILLSFGLFIPWAKVRAVKYKLSCVTVYAADLENYIAGEMQQAKALGEEMSDFLDVDMGF